MLVYFWDRTKAEGKLKMFKNTKTEKDFAYHKVNVVFWQTDEHDQPVIITMSSRGECSRIMR